MKISKICTILCLRQLCKLFCYVCLPHILSSVMEDETSRIQANPPISAALSALAKSTFFGKNCPCSRISARLRRRSLAGGCGEFAGNLASSGFNGGYLDRGFTHGTGGLRNLRIWNAHCEHILSGICHGSVDSGCQGLFVRLLDYGLSSRRCRRPASSCAADSPSRTVSAPGVVFAGGVQYGTVGETLRTSVERSAASAGG